MCTNLGLGIIKLHWQNQGRHYETAIIKKRCIDSAIQITFNLRIEVEIKDFYPLQYIHKEEISYETYEKKDFSICVL